MRKLLIFILVVGLFTSCEFNRQDWRAKRLTDGTIIIIDDLERGYKAGDTISNGRVRSVLLELVNK